MFSAQVTQVNHVDWPKNGPVPPAASGPQLLQLVQPGENLRIGGNDAPLPLPLELPHQLVQLVLDRPQVALAQPVDVELAVEVIVFVLCGAANSPSNS